MSEVTDNEDSLSCSDFGSPINAASALRRASNSTDISDMRARIWDKMSIAIRH